MTDTIQEQAAVALLIERLKKQRERYDEALSDQDRGKTLFLLRRMEDTLQRIVKLAHEPCCQPYESARHTADCRTVTHAPLAFADSGSGLTACGQLGPVDDNPTCDTCTGRRPREGAETYPGVLQPLTARQYEIALEEARGHLADCGLGDYADAEPWRVWNRLNANFEGGVAAFVQAIEPLWAA